MKKGISIILSTILMALIFIPMTVNAEEPIKVYINGELIDFSIEPVIENGTTLVQFRPIFEKLGLLVEWNSETKTVTGERDGMKIQLRIGNTKAYVNGAEKNLSVAPKIINGNTMVPLRFIGESSGKDVVWYGANRVIQIGTQVYVGNGTDFRNASWGMSKDKVMSLENARFTGDKDTYLLYEDTLLNMDVVIIYEFINGKLASAGYVIDEIHTNKNLYIDDYYKLQDSLTQKYGTPIIDEQVWFDDLFKDDYNDWGLAISIGDLTYISQWETPDSDIYLIMNGDNYIVNLGVLYSMKDYLKIVEGKLNLDDL